MRLSIESFADRLGRVQITLPDGSSKVEARVLTVAEERSVLAALPPPEPPLIRDPGKGSLAPKIPDENDPAYRRSFTEWYEQAQVVKMLIGMGYTVGGVPWKEAAEPAAWARSAADELTTSVSRSWLMTALTVYGQATFGKALEEAGPGNSGTSAGQPEP